MLTRTVRALAVPLLVFLDHMLAPKHCPELFELSEEPPRTDPTDRRDRCRFAAGPRRALPPQAGEVRRFRRSGKTGA